MAFSQSWIETDPDGSLIKVSQLDNAVRTKAIALRERLEGDPAVPDLTGLIEPGSFETAPKPRKGAARIYVDTEANILAFDATKREDGRMAVASDTNRIFHAATAAVAEIAYLRSTGGTITPANDTTALTISGSSLTGANAQPLVSLAQTWNTTGAPTGLLLNVTDTASDAASLLADLQVGGVSVFKVSKAGAITANALTITTLTATNLGGTLTTAAQPSITSVGILTGLTLSGVLITVASGAGGAGFRLPHGTAPAAPVDGDMWTTTTNLLVRLNGTTRTVVNTASSQTLTNKTLTAPAISDPTFTGTINGTPAWASSQAITIATAAQPNITSLGNLTGLTFATAIGRTIALASADGSDTGSLEITGGGAVGSGRGAYLVLNGNENTGFLILATGNHASAVMQFDLAGSTRMRLSQGPAADETYLELHADGNLERVGFGAVDSGGAGFRLLRIPN